MSWKPSGKNRYPRPEEPERGRPDYRPASGELGWMPRPRARTARLSPSLTSSLSRPGSEEHGRKRYERHCKVTKE